MPAKYYEQVGQAGFLQKPVGAGPYRLASQQQGVKLEFEAFADYYRPVHIKQLTMVSVPEAATRVAMLERGEADIVYFVPGELIDRVKNNPKLRLAPVVSGNWWLEFPGFQNPASPFHDKRVRQAISLAVDRDAINDAECGGMGVVDGNWINNDVEHGMEWPKWEFNLAKAKKLMAEAGHPNGFTVDWITPVPNYYSRGERIVSQLQAIGIRSRLQVMERGVFLKKMQGGLREWPGVQIIFNATRIGGTWSNWYDSMFRCGGFNSKDFFCVKDLDDQFQKYLTSYDRAERKQLAEQIQRSILENHYFVPVFRHAFVNAIGPRVAMQKWQDVFPTITSGYCYPWEDIKLAQRDRDGSVHDAAYNICRLITLSILSLTIFTVVRLTGDPVTLMAEPGAQEADLGAPPRGVGARPAMAGAVRDVRKERRDRQARAVVQLRDAGEHAIFSASAQLAGVGICRDVDLVRDRHPRGHRLGGARRRRMGPHRQAAASCSACRCPDFGSGWC